MLLRGQGKLSVKNVTLTWGSLQVLHTWEPFDCTAYNNINLQLSQGFWFMNMHDCGLFFFNPSKHLSSQGRKFFNTGILEGWIYLLPQVASSYHKYLNIPHCKRSKLSMALNDVHAAVSHLQSCVQPVHLLLTPDKALMVRPTIRAELLKHWYARAFMLN